MSSPHGGDIDRASRETGIPADQILDFSANINPYGLPPRALERLARDVRDVRLLMRYPDPEALELRRALAQRLEIPIDAIVVGAGADALIHAAVRTFAPKRCLIPIPAFSEYRRACEAHGCTIGREIAEAKPGDLVILNNPHNPTGALKNREEMLASILQIRNAGAMVLADEAFIDYVPEAAITREAATGTGVIAVRSLTKFFGCPGLRVGYAVAAPELAHMLAARLPGWPVTTLALGALAEALADPDFTRATLEANVRARADLADALGALGCRVFPPSANFILFEVPAGSSAPEIHRQLLRGHAILVRDCDSFEGLGPGRYLRVAVRRQDENARLIQAFTHILETKTCQQHT